MASIDENVDIRTLLRKLATKESMPGFDYKKTEFSFKTVYHRTAFSYRICGCGNELVNLQFIDKSGTIIEEVFDRVVQYLIDGECPHVQEVPPKQVRKVRISAREIDVVLTKTETEINDVPPYYLDYDTDDSDDDASDADDDFDTDEDVDDNDGEDVEMDGAPFVNLQPNDIDNENVAVNGIPLFIPPQGGVDNENVEMDDVQFDLPAHIEIMHLPNKDRDENMSLFGSSRVEEALLSAFHRESKEDVEKIMQHENRFRKRDTFIYCILAVIYNQPLVLNKILCFNSSLGTLTKPLTFPLPSGMIENDESQSEEEEEEEIKDVHLSELLLEYCEALERNECKNILSEHGISFENLQVSRKRKQNLLVSLLVNGSIKFLSVLSPYVSYLSEGSSIADVINSKKCKDLVRFDWSLYEHGIETINEGNVCDIHYRTLQDFSDNKILQAWFDLGLGPLDGNSCDVTKYLEFLLHELGEDELLQLDCVNIQHARLVLEAFIYANPSVSLNPNATDIALKIDEFFHSEEKQYHWFQPGSYCYDGQEHGMCGHDADDLALNITTPFLIECGFPIPESLSQLVGKRHKRLPNELFTYFHRAETTPPTLAVSCRNVLRRHFVGSEIHRFVAAHSDYISSFVQDFLLLKPILKCIPEKLLNKFSEKYIE